MKYLDLFNYLKKIEDYTKNEIEIDENLVIRNFSFKSNYRFILSGGLGNKDDYEFLCNPINDHNPDVVQKMLNNKDADIAENIEFRYHIIMPKKEKKAKEIIILFHGFNEKYWNKYLPWATYMAEKTGKAIVLFPMAFHMNRAPLLWSNTREMYRVSEERKKRHPMLLCSSLSNVSISTRINNKPQRFIWSGLQSYYDVIDFVEDIKDGLHPAIDKNAKIDFFSYSIGAFLAELLKMSNRNGYFSDTKCAIFCGGAVFNRLTPVSKFILDSEAQVSLYSFIVEHMESHMKRDEVLCHYMYTDPEGANFRSMLNYKTLIKEREETFRKISNQFYVITLVKDEVIPSYEIVNTLQGSKRDIPVTIDLIDYPYHYIHEDPFPCVFEIANEVEESFKNTLNKFCEFIK
jgi:hypothetical protein